MAHAMKYVGMADRVRSELPADSVIAEGLELVVEEIVAAERRTVAAYSSFRTLLASAAQGGSELAARYLEETVWDLT